MDSQLSGGFSTVVQGKSLLTQHLTNGLRLNAWYTCSGLSQDGCWTGMIESVWPVCIWIGVGEGHGYPHALHATVIWCCVLWYDWLENSLVRALQLNDFASRRGLCFDSTDVMIFQLKLRLKTEDPNTS